MALQIALQNRIVSYSQLTLVDATGIYNADTNPTGWGAPNTALSAVRYAHLIITAPNGVSYDLDIINDLGINFSTVTTDGLVYNIPSALIGNQLGDVLADGTYSVVYKISTTNPFVNGCIIAYDIMTYYMAQDAIFKRIANIPQYYHTDKESIYISQTTLLFMLLQSLIDTSIYYDVVKFTTILDTINDILKFSVSDVRSAYGS